MSNQVNLVDLIKHTKDNHGYDKFIEYIKPDDNLSNIPDKHKEVFYDIILSSTNNPHYHFIKKTDDNYNLSIDFTNMVFKPFVESPDLLYFIHFYTDVFIDKFLYIFIKYLNLDINRLNSQKQNYIQELVYFQIYKTGYNNRINGSFDQTKDIIKIFVKHNLDINHKDMYDMNLYDYLDLLDQRCNTDLYDYLVHIQDHLNNY